VPVTPDGIQSLSFDPATNRIATAGFVYDPAGNQTQNNSGQAFVYDAAGRLAKVKTLGGATLATYTYGASNRRLITQTGSESSTDKTYFIWEGNSVIAEYVEQTSATMPKWSRNYIYLGGRLLSTEAPNGSGEIVHYHHPDRLGTKLVTNNLDTTSFHQANLPFGTALEAESSSGITSVTNRRFTSYDRSTTTGLDYAINRQYDSRQGRFTQVDPLGMAAASLADPQTLNMYSYVGNDPVNRVDPDGQFWGALFRFIAGLFTNLRPNVINGSFTYRNIPPISVALTPNFQHVRVGFAGVGFNLRNGGKWLPAILGSQELPGTPSFVNSRKVYECAQKLFQTSLEGLTYKPDRGLMQFQAEIPRHGYIWDSREIVTITADLSQTVDWLTKMTNAARKGGSAYAWTDPNRPKQPYVARDFPGSAFGLYGKFVHELGNALGFVTGKFSLGYWGNRNYYDDKIKPTPEQISRWEGDDDPGVVFEDCVFGRHVDINDKP
jgi:RHS repeat-associated protein